MAFLVNVLLFCQLEASRDSYHPLPPTYFKRRELWYPQWRKPLLETTTRGLEGNEIRNFEIENPVGSFQSSRICLLLLCSLSSPKELSLLFEFTKWHWQANTLLVEFTKWDSTAVALPALLKPSLSCSLQPNACCSFFCRAMKMKESNDF